MREKGTGKKITLNECIFVALFYAHKIFFIMYINQFVLNTAS